MYLGIKKYDNFNPEIQADKLGPNVEIWEDGRRSGEKLVNMNGGILIQSWMTVV